MPTLMLLVEFCCTSLKIFNLPKFKESETNMIFLILFFNFPESLQDVQLILPVIQDTKSNYLRISSLNT